MEELHEQRQVAHGVVELEAKASRATVVSRRRFDRAVDGALRLDTNVLDRVQCAGNVRLGFRFELVQCRRDGDWPAAQGPQVVLGENDVVVEGVDLDVAAIDHRGPADVYFGNRVRPSPGKTERRLVDRKHLDVRLQVAFRERADADVPARVDLHRIGRGPDLGYCMGLRVGDRRSEKDQIALRRGARLGAGVDGYRVRSVDRGAGDRGARIGDRLGVEKVEANIEEIDEEGLREARRRVAIEIDSGPAGRARRPTRRHRGDRS